MAKNNNLIVDNVVSGQNQPYQKELLLREEEAINLSNNQKQLKWFNPCSGAQTIGASDVPRYNPVELTLLLRARIIENQKNFLKIQAQKSLQLAPLKIWFMNRTIRK